MLLTPLPSPTESGSAFAKRPKHRVLVVGGSYAGLSCILTLLDRLDGKPLKPSHVHLPHFPGRAPDRSVEIVLLDQRDGFFHTVGSPLAHTSQHHIEPFWKDFSSFAELQHTSLKIVQGRLDQVDFSNLVASYEDPGSSFHHIAYDYLVLATGLSRQWPIVPSSHYRSNYVSDASAWVSNISRANHAVVIGGGAVGIEIAGELKHHHPAANVTLVHSRLTLLSNEPLPSEFKEKALELLRAEGVNVILGQRASRSPTSSDISPGQDKVLLASGTLLPADVVFDAAAHCSPNTDWADKSSLTSSGLVDVTSCLMFPVHTPRSNRHFAIGDIASARGIKRAGGAMVMGHIAATNVWAQLVAHGNEKISFAEYPDYGPMMGLAIGNQAVGYRGASKDGNEGVVTAGPEVKQAIFGEDLAWASCLRFMGLTEKTLPTPRR